MLLVFPFHIDYLETSMCNSKSFSKAHKIEIHSIKTALYHITISYGFPS